MQSRVSVPKIFLRGNRWYVRVQVPKEWQERLHRKEYWVSLGTSDRLEALKKATHATQEKRWEIGATYQRLSNTRKPLTNLTDEQRLTLGREAYMMMTSDPVDYIDEFKAGNHKKLTEFIAVTEAALDNVIEKLIVSKGHTPIVKLMALSLMEANAIRLPETSPAYQDLLDLCVEARIECHRRDIARLKGIQVPANANPRLVDTATGEPHGFVPLIKLMSAPMPPKPSLTALVEKFLENPNKLRADKTVASIRGYMAVVIQILGDDMPVEDITEADCERVRDLIRKLPPNFSKLKPLKDRPIEEMVRIARAKGMPKLSPTGVNNYLRWLLTILNWCQRKGMIARVPTAFSEIKVADPVRKEDKRLSFPSGHLSTIFHSDVYAKQERTSSLYWITLIALWNGMRSNEICQLDAADIKLVDGIWGIDITSISSTGDDDKSIKTGSSIRMIPIHPKLIEFGFLKFHKSRPMKAKLFGDITRGADGYYSTNFSKTSNRYLRKIGVHGPKHKFHSFRHNFRDALRKGRVDREIGKALGGWKRGNTDAFDIYGSGFTLEELAAELERVDYPQVDWTHLLTNR